MFYNLLSDIRGRLRALQRDESGAVALMVLAALLILFMVGLVIYDTGRLGEDKLEIQAAADTAAWSQSSVEARAMNMIAFANVGKRVTVGIVAFYYGLWMGFASVLLLALGLAIIACALALIGVGVPFCKALIQFLAKVGAFLAPEGFDLVTLRGQLQSDYFYADIEALDNYQDYMARLAPWWSWSESFVRGFRNGATASSGWPVPRKLSGTGGIEVTADGTTPIDKLPIMRSTNWDASKSQLCKRTYQAWDIQLGSFNVGALASDLGFHAVDYFIKTFTQKSAWKGWEVPLSVLLAGLAAPFFTAGVSCPALMSDSGGATGGLLSKVLSFTMGGFGNGGKVGAHPWMMREGLSPAQWLLSTSNLTFAYRRSQGRRDEDKYQFLDRGSARDAVAGQDLGIGDLFNVDGVWSFARSEISYQNSDNASQPDLWHPSWVARMRPVALPGEWSASNVDMAGALIDVAPYLIAGVAVDGITSGTTSLGDMGSVITDAARIGQAAMGLNSEGIEGLAK